MYKTIDGSANTTSDINFNIMNNMINYENFDNNNILQLTQSHNTFTDISSNNIPCQPLYISTRPTFNYTTTINSIKDIDSLRDTINIVEGINIFNPQQQSNVYHSQIIQPLSSSSQHFNLTNIQNYSPDLKLYCYNYAINNANTCLPAPDSLSSFIPPIQSITTKLLPHNEESTQNSESIVTIETRRDNTILINDGNNINLELKKDISKLETSQTQVIEPVSTQHNKALLNVKASIEMGDFKSSSSSPSEMIKKPLNDRIMLSDEEVLPNPTNNLGPDIINKKRRSQWTPEKIEILQRMLKENLKIHQISRILQMSVAAINRYRRLTCPEQVDGPPKKFVVKKKGRKSKDYANIEQMIISLLSANNSLTLRDLQKRLPSDVPKSLTTLSGIIKKNAECKKLFCQMNKNRSYPIRKHLLKKNVVVSTAEISSSTVELNVAMPCNQQPSQSSQNSDIQSQQPQYHFQIQQN